MLGGFNDLFCSKLCRHKILMPTAAHSVQLVVGVAVAGLRDGSWRDGGKCNGIKFPTGIGAP